MEIIDKTNGTKQMIRRLRGPEHQTPSSFTPADLNSSCKLKIYRISQWSESKLHIKVSTGFYL